MAVIGQKLSVRRGQKLMQLHQTFRGRIYIGNKRDGQAFWSTDNAAYFKLIAMLTPQSSALDFIFPRSDCPHCHSSVRVGTLIRPRIVPKPAWYRLTKTHKRACPECHGIVIATMDKSPWMLLPMAVLIAVGAGAVYKPWEPYVFGDIGMAISFAVICFGAWKAARNNQLLPG